MPGDCRMAHPRAAKRRLLVVCWPHPHRHRSSRQNVNIAGKTSARYARGSAIEPGHIAAFLGRLKAGVAPGPTGQGGWFQVPLCIPRQWPRLPCAPVRGQWHLVSGCAPPRAAGQAAARLSFARGPARFTETQPGRGRGPSAARRLCLPRPARLPAMAPSLPWKPHWPRAKPACWPCTPAPAKTCTIMGLMYRLLKAERWADSVFGTATALGSQALDDFKEVPLEAKPAAVQDLQRGRTGRHGPLCRNPRAGGHRGWEAMVKRILPAMRRRRWMLLTASSWTRPTGATPWTRR